MRFMITIRVSRAIIPYLLERWSRVNGDTARRLAPALSQSGEFAVVLFAADAIQGVIGEPMANLLTLAMTLSVAGLRQKETQQCNS
jgi:Kef-type K+ transport system membrane component KefB